MAKIVLIFMLSLFTAGPCFAQNNMAGMRLLTINAMVQYGQNLYDRGDFNGACAVFNHILTYDAHQAQALLYLKEMGHSQAPQPVVVAKKPLPIQVSLSVKNNAGIEKTNIQVLKTVDILDTDRLKAAIAAKKRVVQQLKAQVLQMRANVAALSVEK